MRAIEHILYRFTTIIVASAVICWFVFLPVVGLLFLMGQFQ